MADKKEYMLQLHTPGDNDNMNSAHIHCKLFWRHSSRSEQPKGNENAKKTGGMTFRITSTQYGWKKIASITLNPLKFKTWKLQERPFHG
jgi:hypothetical protein